MRIKQVITITFMFLSLALFAQYEQEIPRPPTPPKRESVENNNANIQSSLKTHRQEKVNLSKFDIKISDSEDINSSYYFKKIENRLKNLDTSVTPEQIISLTKYNIHRKQIVPKNLDSLANEAYNSIENNKYEEAIILAKKILEQSPNNITGHKELSLAYRKIGKDSLSSLHFEMMKKTIHAVLKFSDGSYDNPFLVNNFFEGLSIYEAAFRCKPKRSLLMLDKKGRILGAYNGCSIISYTELTHWKPELKEGDYRKEED